MSKYICLLMLTSCVYRLTSELDVSSYIYVSFFLLFSVINGGTGPVLAFSEILYKVSKSMDVPFLSLNAWIGM